MHRLRNLAILITTVILIGCEEKEEIILIPEAPSNLVATVVSESEIAISWTDNSNNETSFKIERMSESAEYSLLSSTEPNVTTFKDIELAQNTTYTYRVYAVNSLEKASTKSNEASATTDGLPVISTTEASAITPFTAISGGVVTIQGGSDVVEKGVVWSTEANPTIEFMTKAQANLDGNNFSIELTGLEWETTYHIRAYAINSTGTGYGEELTFTTVSAELSTSPLTDVTLISAISGGTIAGEGGSSIVARGLVWSTAPNPTVDLTTRTEDGTGSGTFMSSITDLDWGTEYFVRAYASNSSTTIYGNEIAFTTDPIIITTSGVTEITLVSASSGGSIEGDAGPSIVARGIVWSTDQNPTVLLESKTEEGIGTNTFMSFISDLTPNVTYYVRAYVSSDTQTSYGQEEVFQTQGTINDIDENSYTVVRIGSQIWMAENLRTYSYNDGTPIENVTDNAAWTGLTLGAYTWYDNNEATYNDTYGAIYNGHAVISGKVCPAGWHVPSDPEWTMLTDYLGGTGIAGGKLKEIGTTHWAIPNVGATDEFGFTGLPGGHHWTDGGFYSLNTGATFWTSSESEFTPGNIRVRFMRNDDTTIIGPSYPSTYGASVRCLMD